VKQEIWRLLTTILNRRLLKIFRLGTIQFSCSWRAKSRFVKRIGMRLFRRLSTPSNFHKFKTQPVLLWTRKVRDWACLLLKKNVHAFSWIWFKFTANRKILTKRVKFSPVLSLSSLTPQRKSVWCLLSPTLLWRWVIPKKLLICLRRSNQATVALFKQRKSKLKFILMNSRIGKTTLGAIWRFLTPSHQLKTSRW